MHQNDTVEWIDSERVPWAGTIENGAFEGCTNLTEVTLAGSMKTIEDSVFSGCTNLRELAIPEGITSLGSYLIRGTGISSITIPSTVTSSRTNGTNGALAGCPALTSVTFASGMKKIPDYICASYDQTSYIQTIILPDSVEEIGSYAFYYCVNLTGEIDIPRATWNVGNGAYQGCQSITSLKFHNNDTVDWSGTIQYRAFSGCTSLASVELAGSMRTLEEYAFSGCTSLQEVTIPEGVKQLGSFLFRDCSALSAMTLSEGVEHLGAYFISGTTISKLTIPSTVNASGTYYTNGALAGCGTLTEVTFAAGTKLIPAYICASESQTSYLKTVVLPDSVEEIGDYAFYHCVNLTGEIDIPRATRNIGNGAYQGCQSVTSLKFHNNDTIEWVNNERVAWSGTIHSRAFSECTSLASVELAGSM